jgi:hypothetical protein
VHSVDPTDSAAPVATPKPSASPVPAAAPKKTASTNWTKALSACRSSVRTRDSVISAARTGIAHWADHIGAQTDFFSKKVSHRKMKAIFAKTRLAGPADVGRYDAALAAADRSRTECPSARTAPTGVKAKLENCSERLAAQRSVLTAAARGMRDWESHLEAMQRSRAGHAHNAQHVWLKAWRAAPPNINAFDRAVGGYRAPTC